jgi:hypothetical protein
MDNDDHDMLREHVAACKALNKFVAALLCVIAPAVGIIAYFSITNNTTLAAFADRLEKVEAHQAEVIQNQRDTAAILDHIQKREPLK